MRGPGVTARALVEAAGPVLEALADAVLIVDPNGLILYANGAARTLYHWGDAAVEGRPAGELFAVPADADADADRGDCRTGDCKLRLANGEEIVVRLSNAPLHDDEGNVIAMIGVARDVTAEAIVVAALGDRERQLTEAEVLAGLGSWSWEPQANKVTWSPGLYRIYGMSPDEPATLDAYSERIHPADRADVQATLDMPTQVNEFNASHRIVRPDGTIRWTANRGKITSTDAAGNPTRVVGVTIDLTEQHDASERVEAFQSIATATSDAMFTTSLDGTITSWNPGAERLYGYPADEAVGRSVRDTIVPADRAPELDAAIAELLGGRRVTLPVTLRRHRENRLVPVAVTASPLRGRDGDVAGVAMVHRDVSNELLLLQQAAQATKLDAVDQLAAGIAHDFANVLTAVGGFLSVAMAKAESGEDPLPEMEDAASSIARGAALIERLLSFTRPDLSRQTAFAVGDVVTDILPVLEQLAGDAAVKVRGDPAPVIVRGDAAVLEQMLVNLVLNARDAMPDGGVIELSYGLEIVTEPPATTFVPLAPGRYAAIRVRDTGTGMDADTLLQCAEPLFTTKPPGAGTGLGLASVVAAARAFGGSAAVASAPGEGTTVTVYWPLLDAGI